MNLHALHITLLVVMGALLALGGNFLLPETSEALPWNATSASIKPESNSKHFQIAHLDKEDKERDWKDGKGNRRYKRHKNCRPKRHFYFCGPKSLKVKIIQDLKFGRVVGDSEHGGRVVIHADSGSKSVNRLYDAGGIHSRAEFEIRGKPGKRFAITLPPKVTLPTSLASKPRVVNFTVFPSSNGKLGPNGKARVFIGATLKVRPAQQGGEGSGSVPIYVDYVR